jgi:signal transduction histidine kinase
MLGAYVRTTTALLATVVLALLGLWAWLARSLSRRLEHITERLPRGDELPVWRKHEAADDDEISALDHGLGAAFARLRKAKETRDEFIARAAHELKTPLGVMAAEMDLALSRERSSEELRAALASSRGEVRRLSELSTKLLDLSAVHGVELDLVDVDFVRLVYESLDQHGAALEQQRIQLRVEAPEQLIVRADPLLVRQAVENLLANAIRYSPEGGALQLTVTCDENSARLDVRDEGPGVPAMEREKIFEPFVRGARAQGPGTGLGLSIVQAIAARLQGSIEIVPSERGAWFRLHIPAGAAQ